MIPDITRRHWAVNIRKFSDRVLDLEALVSRGSLPRGAAEFLRAAMLAGTNVLVSGATQAGKSTWCEWHTYVVEAARCVQVHEQVR